MFRVVWRARADIRSQVLRRRDSARVSACGFHNVGRPVGANFSAKVRRALATVDGANASEKKHKKKIEKKNIKRRCFSASEPPQDTRGKSAPRCALYRPVVVRRDSPMPARAISLAPSPQALPLIDQLLQRLACDRRSRAQNVQGQSPGPARPRASAIGKQEKQEKTGLPFDCLKLLSPRTLLTFFPAFASPCKANEQDQAAKSLFRVARSHPLPSFSCLPTEVLPCPFSLFFFASRCLFR